MGIKIHKSNPSWQPPHSIRAKANGNGKFKSDLLLRRSKSNSSNGSEYDGIRKGGGIIDNFRRSMEEFNAAKAAASGPQPKLTIGQPGDKYEIEADKVASQVMNAPDSLPQERLEEENIPGISQIQRDRDTSVEDDEPDILAKLDVQRTDDIGVEEDNEELIQAQSEILDRVDDEILQTKKSDNPNKPDPIDFEVELNNTRGGGFPLPETTLNFMESRFGAAFRDVRIHDDSTAASMNQSIQAQAFTQGKDIYFNSGKYSPDSLEGKSLLAHELTHVVQQRGDEVIGPKYLIGNQKKGSFADLAFRVQPKPIENDFLSIQKQEKNLESEAITTNQSAPVELGGKEEGISVNPPISFAIDGSTVTYSFNKGDDLAPSSFYKYRWEVHNDKEALERYRNENILNRLNFGAREVINGPSTQDFEVTWNLVGKHTIICYRYTQGKLTNIYKYVQSVRDPVANAEKQFEEKAATALQPDIYLAQLELRKEILENADPQKNADKIKQLDEAIANASEKLGVSEKEPLGNSYPLKAILVPKDVPDSNVPLQLYLRRVGSREQWEILDLTNPAPDAARNYVGTPDPSRLPGDRQRDAITKAWQNYLENTPNPAGQIVVQLPGELSQKVGFDGLQRWNGYSNGISGYQKVRQWLSRVGFGAGLGAIALSVAPFPGSRVAAAWLLLTAGAASAGAGALNIADKLEHGNFQWNGETYLDLVDIVGGLAVGTQATILLRGNAAKVTQLQSAILISESVETGSDLVGGVIISGIHYRRIEEIRQTVTDENKRKQLILEELRNAAATGGLILLGMSCFGGGKKGKGDELTPDSSTTPEIETPGTRPDLSTPSASSVETVIDSLRLQYSTSTFVNKDGLIAVNNQIDIHPNTLQKIESETLNKIVNATKELEEVGGDFNKLSKETQKIIQDLTKTSSGRWRFNYQLNERVNQYLDYVGVKDNEIFQNLTWSDRARLFDEPNSMDYLDNIPEGVKKRDRKIKAKEQEKAINQQAANYALAQNPQNAREFVNYVEFYKAHVDSKIKILEEEYIKKLESKIITQAEEEGISFEELERNNKKITKINQELSQEFFLELYGESIKLDSPKIVKKTLTEKAYESSGTTGNIGQVNDQTLKEVEQRYQQKSDEIENKIATIKVNINLSTEEIIQEIKVIADSLKFSNESAAAYHTLKHYDELPPSHRNDSNQFDSYYQSAIKTIKESTEVNSSYSQNGNLSLIFKATYVEGKTYELQTIVGVSPEGKASILTYFRP